MEGITLMAKREKTPQEIFAEKFVSELQPKTVEDVEEGLKSIFPKTVIQRCIVHLVRNSMKYIPSKEYKAF